MAALINWLLLFALVAIVYFIWHSFVKLANAHGKVPWQFGIFGVGVFASALYTWHLIGPVPYAKLPFGLLVCWAAYHLVKKKIRKDPIICIDIIF